MFEIQLLDQLAGYATNIAKVVVTHNTKSNDKTIENDYLMSEKTIKIEGVDLVLLFGANNKKFERLSNLFP